MELECGSRVTLAEYAILRFVDNEFCYEMLIRAGSPNVKDYAEHASMRNDICIPIGHAIVRNDANTVTNSKHLRGTKFAYPNT